MKRIFRNFNLHEILKGIKTIILTGSVFSLLFITLLRNRPSEPGGFLALSVFSLNEGQPAYPRQAGRDDKKMRQAFFNSRGGQSTETAACPGLYSPDALLVATGGIDPETFHRPGIMSNHFLPIGAGPSTAEDGPAVLPRNTLGDGGLEPSLDSPPALDWLDELIDKIHLVETGGRMKPPAGDNGRAVGALHLHKVAVDDVNRFYRTNFKYSDRSDFSKARLIARLYIQMWFQVHKEEIAARIFNGGPRGWRKKSTDAYWRKIKETK